MKIAWKVNNFENHLLFILLDTFNEDLLYSIIVLNFPKILNAVSFQCKRGRLKLLNVVVVV